MGDWLEPYVGQIVVCDLDEFFLVIGRLETVASDYLAFVDADLHDHREANSTKDVYAIESRAIGVRVNRRRLCVPRARLVAISRLDEIHS